MTHRIVLDNGAVLLVDPMREVRSLALGFFVRAGSSDEPPARQGLSHFLEHVLFKKTRRRSTLAVAREIDRLGGDVDAFTTREYTAFYAHTRDAHFPRALDLIADVVLGSAFGRRHVETERGVILEEIGEAHDDPGDLVHELFVRSFWKHDALGAPILGTAPTVRATTRADLWRHYTGRYTPRNLVVSVAGNVSVAQAARAVSAALRPRRRRAAARRPPIRRARGRRHVGIARRPGLEQVHLCLGTEAPDYGSPRRPAASLVDVVLGGGASSRLFQAVREKRGLAYTVASSLHSYARGGYEAVDASCAPRNLNRLIEVTLRELARLKRGGVRAAELSRARENLKGGLLLAMESTVSRMTWQARQELYFARVVPVERWLARLDAVTVSQASEEADRLLDGRRMALSVVGDVERLSVSAADLAAL
ncbi:MAG TPA: pitrilysin family protein [Thermoanaerobaculia bacterium]|jgi:predicted Zn-dependent peptidase